MCKPLLIALAIIGLALFVFLVRQLIKGVKGLREDEREIVKIEDRLNKHDGINWEEGV